MFPHLNLYKTTEIVVIIIIIFSFGSKDLEG